MNVDACGKRLRKLLDVVRDAFGDAERARADGARHFEPDDGLAVEHRELALLGGLVANLRHGVEPHGAAVRQHDRQRCQILHDAAVATVRTLCS